eukprot:GFUD01030357.1.p1 GENE.GFUD01030357.1~~GFUD01030357.1.p1  ORF type:complete len:398 (+),score=89.46 GFUD01030357.1:51-1244(+)
MSLSKSTVAILKACHPLLKENREKIGKTFYTSLFRDHPQLKNVFNMSHQRQGKDGTPGPQMMALANSLVDYTAHCDELSQLGPLVERVSNKHVSLGVQPEHYPVVGVTLLGALEDVLGKEVFNEEVKTAVAEGYFFLADIFIDKEENMKREKENAVGGWRGWRKLKLVDKVEETPIHTSFYFAPEDGGQMMKYQPGQYLSLRLPNIPGVEYTQVRNYSLSDEPNENQYRITVKKEIEGVASTYLHDKVAVGDVLEVGVPCGDFVLDNDNQSLVYLGAGVGITPLLSMMKVSAKQENKNTLIYRATDVSNHPFKKEIEDLLKIGTNCNVNWLYSDEETHVKSSQFTVENLRNLIPDQGSKIYICGPATFITDSVKYLKQLNFKDENIIYEYFGPPASD